MSQTVGVELDPGALMAIAPIPRQLGAMPP